VVLQIFLKCGKNLRLKKVGQDEKLRKFCENCGNLVEFGEILLNLVNFG
jgi:hypothetical protein